MSTKADYNTFQKLRAQYLVKHEAASAHERVLHAKYGPGLQSTWLSVTERRKQDALRAATDKVGDRFFDLLDRVSPRDWRRGVPMHWVLGQLTWEQATGAEPVEAPKAYGY